MLADRSRFQMAESKRTGRIVVRNRGTWIHPLHDHWTEFLFARLESISTTTMSEAAITVRVRKFMRNPLLKRRQMVCDVGTA